jgi:signal transduction histidine kinase
MLKWIELTSKGVNLGNLEFRIVKPDGTIRDLNVTGVLQNDKDGKPHHVIGSAQDITEIKNSEKTLRQSEMHLKEQNIEFLTLNNEYLALNEELNESLRRIQIMNEDLIFAKDKAEESDKLKTAFLSNISHEIRTPMNAILGFSKLLMDNEISKVKTGKYVQIINTSCKQLLEIINDIIDISKIEAGQLTIDKESVNINDLLKDIYETYKEQFYAKKIGLVYDSKPEFFNIQTETDMIRVKQILGNLITNALKFTQQGMVKFGFDLTDNFITFYVKDSGIGIAPENRTIIFERFRQVENTSTRLYSGNGLGLAISKALVEILGGTITFNSELGIGSTFIFTIPIKHNFKTMEHNKNLVEVKFT